MKVFGNIDFAAEGQVTPDADIGDDRVATGSNTVIVAAGQSLITGMTLTPGAGIHLLTFDGQYSYTPSNITIVAKNDLTALRAYLRGLAPTNTTHPLTFGSGEILTPGVYQIEGAASVAGSLTFDAQGNPDALFIIRCTGAFSTGAASVMALSNQAKASNVFWVSVGAVSIAALTIIKGAVIGDAAIGVGDSCVLEGRVFTISGALAFTNISILPLSVGLLDIQFKSLISFSAFTTLGAISNTGTSEIYGDIGTNGGAVTGFETSTLHGAVRTSGDLSFNVEIGMYLNSVLIPHSVRSFIHNMGGTGVMSTKCLSGSISAGQNISMQTKVILGSMTIGNRLFSSQKFMG